VGWLHRWAELAPLRDRLTLLCPPILIAKFARYGLWPHDKRARATVVDDPASDTHARDPRFVSLIMDLARALGRHYFRLRVEGVENIPAKGGALLVGNHNGGLTPLEPFFTACTVWDRFGSDRAVYALAHDFLFDDPMLRRYAGMLGALRAGHDGANRALSMGHLVLVYPGGDLDAFRPFRDRGKIELGGRMGFIKLALRAGVPIIPVVTSGAHEQFIVLTRGDRLARLLHLHEWARVVVLPLVLAIPWGLTIGFVPYLPLPAQTTIAIGEPITWPHLSAADADNPEALARAYEDVRARMQTTLDRLERGRRFLRGTAHCPS
jgi:1-acyl-sn-glycerol-3-phosphate acyltransferase